VRLGALYRGKAANSIMSEKVTKVTKVTKVAKVTKVSDSPRALHRLAWLGRRRRVWTRAQRPSGIPDGTDAAQATALQ
jgi:hypothetical protein